MESRRFCRKIIVGLDRGRTIGRKISIIQNNLGIPSFREQPLMDSLLQWEKYLSRHSTDKCKVLDFSESFEVSYS